VDISKVDPHDEALLRVFWEVGRAADNASRPYDFYPSWEAASQLLGQERDDSETVLLGAFEDGELRGTAQVEHSLHDNLHAAHVTYYVHPAWQRQGIGRALAEASYDVARERGRRTLVTDVYSPMAELSAGMLFARAMGFEQALVDAMKVVDLPETEHLWDELESRARPRHRDYRIVTWQDRVPQEHLVGFCRLNELFFDEAPMGDLEVEPERWDEARVRERDSRNARTGRRVVAAGALAPDGALVGLTEIAYNEHVPSRAFQSGTLVDPEHRGHALGLAIKLANHRQLRAAYPGCTILMTGNADVNAAMNAVNEQLGYRGVERCFSMQRSL